FETPHLGQGLPKSHLACDPDQQTLQLEYSTQRGIAPQAPVQVQAAQLLRHPRSGRLDMTFREAEQIDDLLEGGAVLFNFLADSVQRLPERFVPAVARTCSSRQLDPTGCSGQVVVQIDGEIGHQAWLPLLG